MLEAREWDGASTIVSGSTCNLFGLPTLTLLLGVVSERLFDRVKTCEIRSEIWGASDHCPLVFELEGDL